MRRMILPVLILLCSLAMSARADLEPLARLTFESQASGKEWIEGFTEIVEGQRLRYHSHRDGSAESLIARADGTSISWRTGPTAAGGGENTFVWVAALADKGSHEQFTLEINGVHKVPFTLSQGWGWTVAQEGARLTFAAQQRDGDQDLFGYMKLTVPAAWIKAGEPAALRITGKDVKSNHWVQTFAYADALADMRKRLNKRAVFDYVSNGPSAGSLKVMAPADHAEKRLTLRVGKRSLEGAVLKSGDNLSIAFLPLPASTLADPRETLQAEVDGQLLAETDLLPMARYRLRAFLEEPLELESYILTPGKVPLAQWKHPDAVRANMGHFELATTLYDANHKPVERTSAPGRYGAVVSARTPDNFSMRRYFTVYCIPEGFDWYDKFRLHAAHVPKLNIPADTWNSKNEILDREVGALALRQAGHDPEFAAFLAGLQEIAGAGNVPAIEQDPVFRDRQWWVTFKCQAAGTPVRPLQLPAEIEPGGKPVLHKGELASAGYEQADIARIDRHCAQWVEQGKAPVSLLVARKGVIVFHKAYGKTPDGKEMTTDTPAPLASTMKMVTGIMAMRFVDQGLMKLDEPIRRFLPEFDRAVPTPITFRHMLTHTAGFDSYGEWGMDHNHSFENFTGQFLPCLGTGKMQHYTGNGFALAGKTMERISGRCVPYLFNEQLFEPLGCMNTRTERCDSGCISTPLDLARIGQMMLNRGVYADRRYFSEQCYEAMLPASLRQTVGVDVESGFGVSKMYQDMLGGGGVSGASVRWSPKHDLVISICRFRTEPTHSRNVEALVDLVLAPLEEKR